jgi:hypothetical protein
MSEGVTDYPDAAYQAHLAVPSTGRTGMHIYTPPEYSDHIAVSAVLLRDLLPHVPVALQKDAKTKFTQPHLKQPSIMGFFSKGSQQKPNGAAIAATGAGQSGKISSSNGSSGSGSSSSSSSSSKRKENPLQNAFSKAKAAKP